MTVVIKFLFKVKSSFLDFSDIKFDCALNLPLQLRNESTNLHGGAFYYFDILFMRNCLIKSERK